jgi:hypothetical protein
MRPWAEPKRKPPTLPGWQPQPTDDADRDLPVGPPKTLEVIGSILLCNFLQSKGFDAAPPVPVTLALMSPLFLMLLLPAAVPQRLPVGGPPPACVPVEARDVTIDPLAADLALFPPSWMVDLYTEYTAAHAEWADQQAALYPSEKHWAEYSHLSHRVANCWALLSCAQGRPRFVQWRFGVWWTPDDREQALTALKDQIGDESFEAGRMPAPVPGVEWTWEYGHP